MLGIRSILNILALGSVMVDNPAPRHLMQKAIYVVVAAILSALLLGATLLAIVAYIYQLVVAYGVSRTEAGIYIVTTMVLLTGIAGYGVTRFIRNFLEELKVGFKQPVPLTTHLGAQAGGILEAFIDGVSRGRGRR